MPVAKGNAVIEVRAGLKRRVKAAAARQGLTMIQAVTAALTSWCDGAEEMRADDPALEHLLKSGGRH